MSNDYDPEARAKIRVLERRVSTLEKNFRVLVEKLAKDENDRAVRRALDATQRRVERSNQRP